MPYTRIVTGKKTTLSKSFTLLMLLVFISGVTLSGITLSHVLNLKARNEVASTANVVMDILNSARKYTNDELTPKFQERMKADEFFPEIIPSYNAKSIFNLLRENHPSYAEFNYKEAMLNPTNTDDKANEFEKKLIERFSSDRNIQSLEDFISLGSKTKVFYTAFPIVIKDSSCLECHSTPAKAPKGMINVYGTNNGFGWQLNKVIGTQVVYVPTHIVTQKAIQALLLIVGIIAFIFQITLLAANFWLKKYVVRPVKQVVRVAEAVSQGDMNAQFDNVSNNEIGTLAEAFTRMKISLEMAISRLDKYRGQNRRGDDFDRR